MSGALDVALAIGSSPEDTLSRPKAAPAVPIFSSRRFIVRLYFLEMKAGVKLAASILLAWLSVVPAMACLAPNSQLTDAEKACCRKMANNCGDMGTDSSHSCCKPKAQSGAHPYVITAAKVSQHSIVDVVLRIGSQPSKLAGLQQFSNAATIPGDHSPPTSISTTILRI
jgi:hypothetical protein